MEKIADLFLYTTEMRKSLIDKIFFMDKIDNSVKTILDYGCADGALVGFLANLFPETNFIGYDMSEAMIEDAALDYGGLPNVKFYSELPDNIDYQTASLNLSSLIHEIYSYSTPNFIEKFWKFVNESGFKYLTIRDMCLDQTAHRPSLKEDILKVRRFCSAIQIEEFEKEHGSIYDNYNLIHFLLKYRYQINWSRECKENYLPLTLEQFINKINSNYELIYFDHYILPFIAQKIKEDMDITVKDYTHLKMIFKRKDI